MPAPYSVDLRWKIVHATERDTARVRQARRRYRRQMTDHPVKRLKFVDESGLNIGMTRRYGRTVRGQRVQDAVPRNCGCNLSLLGALGWYGLDAVMTVDGATDAEVFRAYMRHVLAPTLRAGDIVVMDNLSVHKVPGIAAMITATGAQLITCRHTPRIGRRANHVGRKSKPGCGA